MQRAMRKTSKEITDRGQMEKLLRRAPVMRLAMALEGQPYVVPLNFAYENGAIYFHSGEKGLKMEILDQNPRVCFEVDLDVEPIPNAAPCDWGCRYQSVIGFGQVEFLEDEAEKIAGLNVIMRRYSGGEFEFPAKILAITRVGKIQIDHMSGAARGFKNG